MKRVIFYFDGFNFYNGLKDKASSNPDWKNYYWIDFYKFATQFFDDQNEIVAVKYFTAPPLDPNKKSRQSALFKANEILNPDKFIVINGQYQHRKVSCLAQCKREFHLLGSLQIFYIIVARLFS